MARERSALANSPTDINDHGNLADAARELRGLLSGISAAMQLKVSRLGDEENGSIDWEGVAALVERAESLALEIQDHAGVQR